MIWWIENIWVRDDPSQPHLIAYLCHIDGIRDDALNVREMKTVYDLIRFQYQEEKYKQHQIIPVSCIQFLMRHLNTTACLVKKTVLITMYIDHVDFGLGIPAPHRASIC